MTATRPTRRRSRGRLVLTALVVAAVAVGCRTSRDTGEDDLGPIPPTTAPADLGPDPADDPFGLIEDDYTGEGPKVVVLGDTILHQARQDLRAELEDHAVKVGAVVAEGLSGGPVSAESPDADMLTVARAYAADRPEVAVVGLGTYDVVNPDGSVEEAEARVDEIAATFADSCLVVVTITERGAGPDYDVAEAARINARLRSVADAVADWQVQGVYRGLRDQGGIVPTEDGRRRLAELVAEAVEDCEGP